jgi:hypothetical protein
VVTITIIIGLLPRRRSFTPESARPSSDDPLSPSEATALLCQTLGASEREREIEREREREGGREIYERVKMRSRGGMSEVAVAYGTHGGPRAGVGLGLGSGGERSIVAAKAQGTNGTKISQVYKATLKALGFSCVSGERPDVQAVASPPRKRDLSRSRQPSSTDLRLSDL